MLKRYHQSYIDIFWPAICHFQAYTGLEDELRAIIIMTAEDMNIYLCLYLFQCKKSQSNMINI